MRHPLYSNCQYIRHIQIWRIKDSTAEQLYHAITNFEQIVSTCISCFLLSDIVPLSRLLQTETLDFATANQYVDNFLDTFEQRKHHAQDYFHNIIYSHVDELCKELFVQPSIPRHSILALRKKKFQFVIHNNSIVNTFIYHS
jgi:hypothetical protein